MYVCIDFDIFITFYLLQRTVFNSQCNNIHIHITVQLTSRYNLDECASCENIEPFVNTLTLLLRATREWKSVCLSCKLSLFKLIRSLMLIRPAKVIQHVVEQWNVSPDWNLNVSIRFCASCAILCNILKSWYIKMSVHLYLLSVDRGFLSYLSTGSCASTAPISYIYCSIFVI